MWRKPGKLTPCQFEITLSKIKLTQRNFFVFMRHIRPTLLTAGCRRPPKYLRTGSRITLRNLPIFAAKLKKA